MIKIKHALIVCILLSSCSLSSKTSFSDYMSKEKACDYINVGTVKSALAINKEISKQASYSDSFFNGFIGAQCELTWEDNDENDQTISFNLTQLKSNEVFPPKKLSEQQLLNKIAQANKATLAYASLYDKSTIDTMKRNNEVSIRNGNDYKIIKIQGNEAIFNTSQVNDLNLYTIKVLIGKIVIKVNLTSEAIKKAPKEKLIKLVNNLIAENK